MEFNTKKLIGLGLVWVVIQAIISAGIFVTFPQMEAYAASKDSFEQVVTHLENIEKKLDKLIMGY